MMAMAMVVANVSSETSFISGTLVCALRGEGSVLSNTSVLKVQTLAACHCRPGRQAAALPGAVGSSMYSGSTQQSRVDGMGELWR
jgi:hypothetical protein